MTIAFISDLHLDPSRPESTLWFGEFMQKSRGLIEQIYILGDLFEVWIGDDGRDIMGQGEVEKIIRACTEADQKVFFIHGNRDFLVGDEFQKRTGCQLLPDPTVVVLGSSKVLLTHGDTLCTDDVEHQRARKEMVTSKWKIAFLDKSIDERKQTAQELRRQSEVNKQFKSMAIMDVNQQQVERVMSDHNVTTMIHGHTHKPAVHQFELGGKPAKRYVLGDWFTQRSVLYYDDGCFTLRR